MKRWAVLATVIVILVYLAAPVLATGSEDDLRVIKKAVKSGHSFEPGGAVKWFKILVTDKKSGKDTVKITLPISMARLLAHCAKDRHMHADKADIDIEAALRDLDEMTPMTLLEIVDDDATIKIWLE